MSESDKRVGERVTINKEFESFDAFIQEYVTNISRTGVFIKSQTPLAIGTQVNLRFTVIMDDIETIEGIGKGVRVETYPPGMGVVFRELNAYLKGLIYKPLTQKPCPPTSSRPSRGSRRRVVRPGQAPRGPARGSRRG